MKSQNVWVTHRLDVLRCSLSGSFSVFYFEDWYEDICFFVPLDMVENEGSEIGYAQDNLSLSEMA